MKSVVGRVILLSFLTTAACGTPSEVGGIPAGMAFVPIPAGSFMMGSPEDEVGRYVDEGPLHEVSFQSGFSVMTTEVTQAMWVEVMGSNPSTFSADGLPVEGVSWEDCHEFTEALCNLDPSHEYRLPTEAEWEYACRAGTVTAFHSGDTEGDLELIGWFSGNSGGTTMECGSLEPNGWGLYDMSGNVWEWCEDDYHDDYSGAPQDGSAWSDGQPSRVSRGGSSGSAARRCRSAARDECDPNLRYQYLGFRVVRIP